MERIDQNDVFKIFSYNNPLYNGVIIQITKNDYIKVCRELGYFIDSRDTTLEASVKTEKCKLIKAWFMPEFHAGNDYARFCP